jgi:hypothetical protein
VPNKPARGDQLLDELHGNGPAVDRDSGSGVWWWELPSRPSR